MFEPDDCEFVAALVAAGVPMPGAQAVGTATREWAEKETSDVEESVGS